jgi:hypothetical protein
MKKILHCVLIAPFILMLLFSAAKYCMPQTPPGGGPAAPVAQTPAPLDPAQEAKKSELLAKGSDETRSLDERKKALDDLLKLDPNNLAAIDKRNQVRKEIAVRDQKKSEEEKNKLTLSESQSKFNSAIAVATAALGVGNLGKAKAALAPLDQTNSQVTQLTSRIRGLERIRSQKLITLCVFGGVLIAGLGALVVRSLRSKKMAFRVMDGVDEGYVIPIEAPRVRVGSNPDHSEIVIADDSRRISRVHFELYRSGNRWYVRDLSSNGTKVNDQPLTRGETALVKPGDMISLADAVTLEFFAASKEVLQQANAGGV